MMRSMSVGAAFLLTISASASLYRQPNDIPLVDVVSWVTKTGVITVARANVATALGLASNDIAVRERGFRQSGEALTHVFAVVIEPLHKGNVIIARIDEASGSGIVWHCSASGQLIATLALEGFNGATTRIPDQNYEVQFVAEKRYFLQKFSESEAAEATSNRTSLSSEPKADKTPVTPARSTGVLKSELNALFSSPWSIFGFIIVILVGFEPVRRKRSHMD